MTLNSLIGFILAFAIAALAYKRGSLSQSGANAAVVIGALIFSIGGLTWAVLLVAFFVTSSALSHYKERVKEPLAEKFQKGHRRDWGQVLANGGCAALIAIAFAIVPHRWHFIGFVGAMATVNADTWATELGVLSKTLPRLITTGRVVPIGTSGGITWLGAIVALAGALLIGILAFVFEAISSAFLSSGSYIFVAWQTIVVAAIAGLAGALFDSFLGATVQAMYYCDVDQKETESAMHRCGNATRLIRGWRWLDNDWVNFISSVFGSLVALGVYLLLTR
jgi:uncharacterized protein (TIGR00297 family)